MEKELEICFGFLGNGITVWTSCLETHESNPRYEAHISPKREITYYQENTPKYFIDAVEWASWRHPHTGDVFPVSYEFETQMYRKDSHSAFDISFHSSWSLDQVEAFVEALFASGVCDYYELFYSEEE